MNKLFKLVALALGFGSSTTILQAQGFPCCVTYQTCVVTTYRPEWREDKVACVVDKWTSRVVVDRMNVKVLVPHWVDEKRVVVSCYYEPKLVESAVVRCCWVPVWYFDPCTCCPYVCWRPQTYVQRVASTIYVAKSVQTVVPVKECRMVLEDRPVETRRVVWENHPQRVISVRRTCVMVPQSMTVTVPVYVPCCFW
jgi:hypothetical protein